MLKALTIRLNVDELSGLQLFQLIRYGSLLLISIILIKSGMDQETFGRYELVVFITGAVSFFWLTGIIQSLLPLYKNSKTFASKQDQDKSPEIYNAFLLLLSFSLIGAGLLIIIGTASPGLVEEKFHPELVPYLAAFIIFQTPSALTEYIYTLRKEGRKVVLYGILAFGIQLSAVSVPAMLGLELRWVLTGLVGSALLRFVWVIILVRKVSEIRVCQRFILEHLRLGAPIMLSVLLSGSATYIDGFIVTGYFDENVFAVFRNGARELPLVALLAHALSSAIVPKFPELGTEKALGVIKDRSRRLLNYLFPLSLVLIVASYYIFPLVYDASYFDSAGVFNLYLLLIISRLIFPQTILIGLKKTNILVLASGIELVLNIALSLFLVKVWGIRGVALATLIAYFVERVFLVAWIKIRIKINPDKYINLGRHLVWSLIIIAAFIIVEMFIGRGFEEVW